MAKLTEDEILKKVKDFRADGIDGSGNLHERMQKAENFVIGGDLQWDPGVKEAARDAGKFTLTIPIVKPQVKQISGSEIQNPQDFIVKNTAGGSDTVARILTALTKQAADSERERYERSQCFESGLSSGQGVMGIFIDKTDDPKHANLRIEKLNEHNAIVDPNASSYNINKRKTGAKYVIYEEPVDKEELELEYPDKKEELAARGTRSFLEITAGHVTGIIDWLTGRRSAKETSSFAGTARTDAEVMFKNRYTVCHTWWREPKKCVHWFDKRKSEIDSMFLLKDEEIAAAKKATEESPEVFEIEEVNSFVMHHTIRVGDTFLEDIEDELNGVQMYPLVFYWPYWINGYKSGIAEDLIGTQEEINWTHSMSLNLIKKLMNKGFKIKSDTNKEFGPWLEEHGGDNNLVIDESRGGGKVEELTPSPLPAKAIESFTLQAMDNARRITGIRSEAPEKDDKQMSGRAIFLKQKGSAQGTMSVFLNWNYTLAILGDLRVDIIRKNDIFSEDEIRAIVDKDGLMDEEIFDQAKGAVINIIQKQGGKIPSQPKPINPIRMANAPPQLQAEMLEKYQQEVAMFQQFINKVEEAARPMVEETVIQSIREMKAGKYNTKVVTSPMAETVRAMKAMEVFELHKLLIESQDVGLDGEDLIDATDAPNKEQLKLGRRRKIESVTRSA